MAHRIVKEIRNLKVGEFFVSDYRGSDYKLKAKPPRTSVKVLVDGAIVTIFSENGKSSILRDNYLNENRGFVYLVEPIGGENQLDFKWQVGNVKDKDKDYAFDDYINGRSDSYAT